MKITKIINYMDPFYQKGFTLIELLVVIAVIGILAAIVLLAINPAEQLARGRDAGRKTAIGQLSRALQSYSTVNNSSYPAANTTWINALTSSSDIKSLPAYVSYSLSGVVSCTTAAQNGFCYATDVTNDAVAYIRLESGLEKNKCTTGGTTYPFFLWSSKDGRTGTICHTSSNGPSALSSYSYN